MIFAAKEVNILENQQVQPLTGNLDTDITMIKSVFAKDDTFKARFIDNRKNPTLKFCICYIDGMSSNTIVDDFIVKPLTEGDYNLNEGNLIDIIANSGTVASDVVRTTDFNKALSEIIYGNCLLFVDTCKDVLILEAKGWDKRGISEPDGEKTISGPREGFIESIQINKSMLRRKLQTTDLKFETLNFGKRSKTKACVCYLDSVVNKDVLNELKERLDKISIDGVLDVNYLRELITDSPYSPVKTLGTTEKPDIVAAKLLEGRVAVFLDGTPMVLTLPYVFIENFQSDEDYYVNYYYSSICRILRIIAFFISTSTPALYVALTTFHQEMLPTSLILSIDVARQGVPFPTVVETFVMLIVFELIRESGSRIPNNVGSSLSIVGALVIGDAAVSAKLVSASVVIVVAFTAIAGLMVVKIKGFSIIVRMSLLILASFFGIYGYIVGMVWMLLHLCCIKSFGVPSIGSGLKTGNKNCDFITRAPWWKIIWRPEGMSKNRVRQQRIR